MDLTDAIRTQAPQRTTQAPRCERDWHARLELTYGRDGARTVPLLRRHVGPLRVQKGLLPEGPGVWHQIVVHPPGGIAGGDRLDLRIAAHPGAHALLTTPGATKWYRSAGSVAVQRLAIDVASGAALEWLPAESIVFDGARARLETTFRVAAGGTLVAAELTSLGRPAAGERFVQGALHADLQVLQGERPLFVERAALAGGHRLLDSPVGLAGRPLFGMLLAVSDRVDDALVAGCRAVVAHAGEAAVTRCGRVLLVRWRGTRADEGLRTLRAAWAAVRPGLLRREAVAPRIWAT